MMGRPLQIALLTNMGRAKDVDNQIVDNLQVHYWSTWDVQKTPLIRPNALQNALLTECTIVQMQCRPTWHACWQKHVVDCH